MGVGFAPFPKLFTLPTKLIKLLTQFNLSSHFATYQLDSKLNKLC